MLFLFVVLLRLGTLLGSLPSLSHAQAQLIRQQLVLGSLTTVNGTETSRPHAYDIPAADQLSVSIALCGSSLTSDAAFYVTNNTRQNVDDIIAQGGDDSTWAVDIQDGFGVWTGAARDGAIIAFKSANATIEIGVSTSDPVHRRSDELPWLGDSTSNLAIVYSPLLSPSNTTEPEFPNYTLQTANATMDTPSEALNNTNFTFSIFPTSSSLDSTVPKTGCALRAASGTVGKMVSDTLWQRPGEGWRNEWLIGGLSPATNYTMYSIINGTQISGPLYFTTKSASFACTLVHKLPFCPGISYAVPLAAPQFPRVAHDASSIPSSIAAPLLEYMTNFTVSLSTFACGRDFYSPLQSCADCQDAYRRWLCAVQFPRCTERPPPSSSTTSESSSTSSLPTPAFAAQPSGIPRRNANFPAFTKSFDELLPCLEICQAVDRACPAFLGFKCPVVKFNAAESYGVGFIDDGGKQGRGVAGVAQDEHGNVWCNSG